MIYAFLSNSLSNASLKRSKKNVRNEIRQGQKLIKSKRKKVKAFFRRKYLTFFSQNDKAKNTSFYDHNIFFVIYHILKLKLSSAISTFLLTFSLFLRK